MFLVIFATIGWVTLIVSWGMMFLFSSATSKANKKIIEQGLCPSCGHPLVMHSPQSKEKSPMGFHTCQ